MKVIDIIKYNFGFSTKEAKEYLKTIDKKNNRSIKTRFRK